MIRLVHLAIVIWHAQYYCDVHGHGVRQISAFSESTDLEQGISFSALGLHGHSCHTVCCLEAYSCLGSRLHWNLVLIRWLRLHAGKMKVMNSMKVAQADQVVCPQQGLGELSLDR